MLVLLQRLNANFLLVPCAAEGLAMSMDIGGTEGTAGWLAEGSIASNSSVLTQKRLEYESLASCHSGFAVMRQGLPQTLRGPQCGPEVRLQMILK